MFYFKLSYYHLYLHSFPTRRSSDLAGPGRRSAPGDRPRVRRFAPSRSEEHTSELQSHSDIVCRLLLEKKKKRICKVMLINIDHDNEIGDESWGHSGL